MIRFQLLRHRNEVLPLHIMKTEKNLRHNIIAGLTSQPNREIQSLDIKIYDSPIKRFFLNLLGKKHNHIPVKMKADFTRTFVEEDTKILSTQRFHYTDKFSYEQLKELKNGKELVNHGGTFINTLVNNINKAIER